MGPSTVESVFDGRAVRDAAAPGPTLRSRDAIALVVGIVVGAGIFRTPGLVAANSSGEAAVLLAWALGGAVSFVGALCYAELAATYPSAGGDYHFLTRAYGHKLSFLFAWARLTVIQTGSIALLAFIFGDYASQIVPLGEYSSSFYAAAAIAALTALNIAGVHFGAGTQNLLTAVEVLGLLLVIVAGLFLAGPAPETAAAPSGGAGLGLAMVFVLLTYGGWNEAAYLSAELKDARRNIARVLMWGIAIITALYLLVNWAYLRGLGFEGLAGSEAAAADLMRGVSGEAGAAALSALVAVSALTSANATIFTGARTNYALGRDVPAFAALGRWSERAAAPVTALAIQGAIALALVLLGSFTRGGFATAVDYTAPVFWLFFLLTGVSLFVLRRKEPDAERPFRVPLYPLTPLLFCATSAYLLYSSLAYTGVGAAVGVAVLASGAVVLAAVGLRRGAPERPVPEGKA